MRSEKRRRIYLSVDQMTYSRLSYLVKRDHYKNECQLVESMINVALDMIDNSDKKMFDIPDEDRAYLDSMFRDMSNVERQADGEGSVSVTRFAKGGGEK